MSKTNTEMPLKKPNFHTDGKNNQNFSVSHVISLQIRHSPDLFKLLCFTSIKYVRHLRYVQKVCVRDEFGTQLLKLFVLKWVHPGIPMAVAEFSFTFLLHFGAIQF